MAVYTDLKPTHKPTHPAKYAVTKYAERIHQERDKLIDAMCDAGQFDYERMGAITDLANEADNLHYNISNMVVNYCEAQAVKVWADFCQSRQLCEECGGELIVDMRGGVYGNDPADVAHVLLCRECGEVSNWQPVEVGIADELPI